MKKLIAIAVLAVLALSGCATAQYEAYSKATEAREKRLSTEATSRQLVDQTLMLQVAKVANECKDSACHMGVLLVLSNLKNQQTIQPAPPPILAPVNEALEWAKVLVPAVTGAYTSYLGATLGIVNSTKGEADSDVASNALISITPVAPWATPIK